MNDKTHRITIHTHQKIITMALIALMIFISFIDIPFVSDAQDQVIISNILVRSIGGFIVVYWMIILGYAWLFKFHKGFQAFIIMIPGFLISINNFPIIAFLDDRASLTAPLYRVFLFFLECLSVGFFEEVIFRVVLLIFLLKTFSKLKMNLIFSIVLSSLIFALSHIFNLFSGASYSDTFLQIGYSFLVGMMWAVMFLKTKNIWLTILLHATFNFFGQVMFYLGDVSYRYDFYTVIITIILGLCVTIYTYMLYKKISYKSWIHKHNF
ncbi:hypothetical protein BK010_00615 [Tenericutes bacterium MO-XQ]|nr:hypothetical protein BK010_00615 [Tenericutes bacterium MO-XQ]